MSIKLSGDQYIIKLSSANETIKIPAADRTLPPRLRLVAALVVNSSFGTGASDTHLIQIRGFNYCNVISNDTAPALLGDGIVIPLTAATTYWQPEVVVENRYLSFLSQLNIQIRDQDGDTPTFSAIYLFLKS